MKIKREGKTIMTAKTAKLHLDYRHAACERLTADTDATLNDDATENYFRLAHPGLEDYDLEDIEAWIVLATTPTRTAVSKTQARDPIRSNLPTK